MVEIKPDEISAILREQLNNFNAGVDLEEVGTVLQVGDGIARVYGLGNVRYGELVEFENGVRAIPSPTCNTVPTSSRSTPALKLFNCSRSIALISSGLISTIKICVSLLVYCYPTSLFTPDNYRDQHFLS